MASAQAQTIRQKPNPPVPAKYLLDGVPFRKWESEDTNKSLHQWLVKVDEAGLVLCLLRDQHQEGIPIYLSEVVDVRIGQYAQKPKDTGLQEMLNASAGGVASFEDIAVTIVHGTNMVDVNFINLAATTASDAAMFASEVFKLLNNTVALNMCEETMLRREYARLCTLRHPDKDGIAYRHFQSLFPARNKEEFKRCMSSLGCSDSNGYVPCSSFTLSAFIALHDELVSCEYLADVLVEIQGKSCGKPYATVKQVTAFLNGPHRDPRLNEILVKYLKEDDVRNIITEHEPQKDYASKGQLTTFGLRQYLRSKDNAVTHLSRFALHQDMEQPLCHYFINSSHNSYLTGHQLTGKATVEIYRQVLLSGCRCLELDCWDGSDGEPVITHGNTLVNNIPFKDVIEAINESAFKVSQFPVILSFENHCRFRQQRRMVHYLRSILGDKLMLRLLDDFPLSAGTPLPPPSKLMGKIICKNKRLVPKQERSKDDEPSGQGPKPSESDESSWGSGSTAPNLVQERNNSMSVQARQKSESFRASSTHLHEDCGLPVNFSIHTMVPVGSLPVSSAPSTTTLQPETSDIAENQVNMLTVDQSEICLPSMSSSGWCDLDMPSLVNYAEPIKFKSFDESEQRNRHYQMSSFAETAAIRLVLDSSNEFVKYCQRQNCRIYPRGTRVDSSNYQPQVFWNVGCQMVALNFQTLDLPMQLNQGKFDYNGKCGYLLKPEVMRRSDRDFDPFVESPIDNIVAISLSVKVVAGHLLSSTKDSVRVEVDMYGIPADTVRRRFRTKYMPNDLTVNFNATTFLFKKVVLVDHAMLRFTVVDSQGSLLGMRILPLDGLEPGFRFVHLNNENNQSLPLASLFVSISLTEYIPEEFQGLALELTNPVLYQKQREEAICNMLDEDPLLGDSPSLAALPPTIAVEDSPTVTRQPRACTVTDAPTPSTPSKKDFPLALGRRTSSPLFRKKNTAERTVSKPQSPSIASARAVLMRKDAQKPLAKANKEISGIRRKFLKAHASMCKSKAVALKKAANLAEIQAKMTDTHVQDVAALMLKSLDDEEATLLKQLPVFFNLVITMLSSKQAAELKAAENQLRKESAALIATMQKENAQKSHQYKEDQKRKGANKEELQRKIREYSNKLVEAAVQARCDTMEKHDEKLQVLQDAQQAALSEIKGAEEHELDRVKKLYIGQRQVSTTTVGSGEYCAMALADGPFELKMLASLLN